VTETFDWPSFLAAWSHDVMTMLRKATVPLEAEEAAVLARGTLLNPGATESELQNLEARLETPLPPSYRAFLQASNGWLQVAMDAEDGTLWSTHDVRWFRDQDPDWIDAYTVGFEDLPEAPDDVYYVYDETQDPVHLRRGYLKDTLAVSASIDSSIYLLNPRVRSEHGEWEAWYFANWLPGAQRYRSFQAMMVAERVRVLENLRMGLAYRGNKV
jgi:hypothetical protein